MCKNQDFPKREVASQRPDQIVFSLADGFVWVSWPGTAASIRLGKYQIVRTMMRDFLRQSALGDRFAEQRVGVSDPADSRPRSLASLESDNLDGLAEALRAIDRDLREAEEQVHQLASTRDKPKRDKPKPGEL